MAGSKLQNLTAAASVADTDILYGVTTPATTPADAKVSLGVLKNSFSQYTLYASTFSGADMGAQTNAAYAALPSTGGTIIVPGGNYSHSTQILFGVQGKHVILKGTGGWGGTTLTWTGAGTTIALQYNASNFAGIQAGHSIQDISFIGPDQTGSTVGILLGGLGAQDNRGASGVMVKNVHIKGFGLGLLVGNNCYLMTLENVVIDFCGKLLFEKGGAGAGATTWLVNGANTINSGENMRVINCTFADAHNAIGGASLARYAVELQCSGLTDWNFIGTSFDDAELYVNKSGGQGNTVQITDCHFENPGSQDGGSYTKYDFITMLGGQPNAILAIVNTSFILDGHNNVQDELINAGSQVSMIGCTASLNTGASASTVVNWVTFQNLDSTNSLRWWGCHNIGSAVTNICTGVTFVGSGIANGTGIFATITGGGVIKGRIQPRISALSASSATPACNTDAVDLLSITGQTADITSFTTSLTGTPVSGQRLIVEVTGTASRALTWGTSFEASTVALPTTTSSTAMLHIEFIWNAATSKWRCIVVA